MLSKLFRKRHLQVMAPINGKLIALDEVPDPVFSEKMMGDGIAILPAGGNVYSPIDGMVILVAETKHAVGIRSTDGTEILIHIGLETVSLKGEGFTSHVKVGDSVSTQQLLIEVDWDFVCENGKNTITPIVITNSSEKNIQCTNESASLIGETVIMNVSRL